MSRPGAERKRRRLRRLAPWLLVIPGVLPLLAPVYARTSPKLGAFPFFVWFQFAIVVLGVVVVGLVFVLRERQGGSAQ